MLHVQYMCISTPLGQWGPTGLKTHETYQKAPVFHIVYSTF